MVYLLRCGVWVHVLPVHMLLRKIQVLSRSVHHVRDVVVAVVLIKAPVLNIFILVWS